MENAVPFDFAFNSDYDGDRYMHSDDAASDGYVVVVVEGQPGGTHSRWSSRSDCPAYFPAAGKMSRNAWFVGDDYCWLEIIAPDGTRTDVRRRRCDHNQGSEQ